jgi:hypothetical protein
MSEKELSPEIQNEIPKAKSNQPKEMTTEESRSYRAALYKPTVIIFTEEQKKEQFRVFWTANKNKYKSSRGIEKALWLHLKAIGMDSADKFEQGLKNFGLKKIK